MSNDLRKNVGRAGFTIFDMLKYRLNISHYDVTAKGSFTFSAYISIL